MSFWNGVSPQAVSEAEDGFGMFAIGDNEAHIKSLEEKVSQSGNPMLVITFANEEGAEIKHYIVDNERKLSNLKNICKAFGIPFEQSIYPNTWIGKKGIVFCKKDEYNGKEYPKVSYFKPLHPVKQNNNPAPTNNSVSQERPPMESGYMTPGTGEQGGSSQEFYDDIPF